MAIISESKRSYSSQELETQRMIEKNNLLEKVGNIDEELFNEEMDAEAEYGPDTEEGQVIRRLNTLHERFALALFQEAYVLGEKSAN